MLQISKTEGLHSSCGLWRGKAQKLAVSMLPRRLVSGVEAPPLAAFALVPPSIRAHHRVRQNECRHTTAVDLWSTLAFMTSSSNGASSADRSAT